MVTKQVKFGNAFDKENNVRLEEKIKLHHLEQLMQEFEEHKPDDILVYKGSGYFPPRVKKRTPGNMNIEEFKDTVSKVLQTSEYDEYLEKLFTKLDTSCDGYVDWNEFCTYMLLLYRENDFLRSKREIPFVVDPKIRHIVHNRQETTTRLFAVENPTRYITISKEGAMSVWQPNMMFEKHYLIRETNEDGSSQKRRFHMWITDAVYMANCNKIALASTSRDIRFYDVSTNQYFEEFHLFSMPDVPYCFDYWYDTKNPNTKSLLLFGVDSGAIHMLCFHKPVTQLFVTPFKSEGGSQRIFMQDLPNHSRFVTHSVLLDVHPDMVRQVKYLPDNDAIVSCCLSSQRSLVITDSQKVKKSYIFKLDKGVECFDYNKDINILVTGSSEHLIRIWNPYVTSKPINILEGHVTGIIGIVIHEELNQIFSYSMDAVVKVWDIKEHTCLQTQMIKFPSSIHGKMPENGQFPIFLHQQQGNSSILVTSNDYVAMLKLGRIEPNTNTAPTTHDTQLCCAIYNPHLKQIATGCDSSCVAAWDVETGQKSIVFNNAHGNEEITAMAFDQNWRRLLTGARNGTIKIWNFQNGHNLNKLESIGDSEVTGLITVADRKLIMAVGWNRLITLYDDSNPDSTYIDGTSNWKGGQLHNDDILAIDFAEPHFVATASFDGEIIVWDLETEKVFNRLRKGRASDIAQKIESLKSAEKARPTPPQSASRPNSRHRRSHKVPAGHTAPVDKLLFLRARANSKSRDSAILVSSEAGILRWWCPYLQKPEVGYFYAPDTKDESILAMCSKPNCSLLITGDTQGFIQTWNIFNYCTKCTGQKIKTKPKLEGIWRAHDSAIVSVDFINHTDGLFIVSASTDKTARLWNLDGHYIGTFGQKKPWRLRTPSTWAHPETPWSMQDKPKDEENNNIDIEEDVDETEENDLDEPSGDYHSLVKCIPDETFLGVKVEDHLIRMKEGRQCRRNNYGGIDSTQMARYGKICSPYHALITPDVEEPRLPQNLPLSQRMINRGYHSQTITDDQLKEMDFSFGVPSTPNGMIETPRKSKEEVKDNLKLPNIRSNRTSRSSVTQSVPKKNSGIL